MLRIKLEIEKRGISQSQLARMAGVNQTCISRIVNGKEPAYPRRGRRIAEALGWEGHVEELFKEIKSE